MARLIITKGGEGAFSANGPSTRFQLVSLPIRFAEREDENSTRNRHGAADSRIVKNKRRTYYIQIVNIALIIGGSAPSSPTPGGVQVSWAALHRT